MTKPATIPNAYDAVPVELRKTPSWLLWDYRLVDGRWSKIPLIADRSRSGAAKSNDHRTWRSFNEAMALANTASGLGMVLTQELCGIDLDRCRDRETGKVAPWAQRIVDAIDSYTEISPSGEGLHIVAILEHELPQGGRKLRGGKERAGWEIAIFDKYSPRYFAMTGVIFDGHDEVRRVDLGDFYRKFEQGAFDPVASNGHKKRNDKFSRLMAGDWGGLYGSQSEADAALVWFLADKYGNDPALIDKAFRASGMMRSKWDEARPGGTYGSVTIDHCLEKRRRPSPHGAFIVNEAGKMCPVVGNAITMLRDSSEWENVLALNLLTGHVVSRLPAPWQEKAGENWTDFDDTKTCEWLQHRGLLIKTHIAAEAVQAVAKENPFHPIKDYLEGLVWDGKPRLGTWLIDFLGCADIPFVRAVGPRWMISAVARIVQPGAQVDHTLVLEGPQGSSKSSALRALAGDEWFTDTTAELGSKDSRLNLQGIWIIELGELDKVKRGDQERVKAFLTCRVDRFRPPYGRRDEEHRRSCVFAGSVNDSNPFTDETGGRRFWPVKCGVIDVKAITEHRDQLWAEAVQKFKAGEPWWLETEELNKLATKEQESRYNAGPWDELIEAWIEDPIQARSPDGENRQMLPINPFDSMPGAVTATDVLIHCVVQNGGRVGQSELNSVTRCLTHLGWERDKGQTWKDDRKRRVRFWRAPKDWEARKEEEYSDLSHAPF